MRNLTTKYILKAFVLHLGNAENPLLNDLMQAGKKFQLKTFGQEIF